MIKKIKCGLCKTNPYIGARHAMRKHLREEHLIKKKITTSGWSGKALKYLRQNWWIEEPWKS